MLKRLWHIQSNLKLCQFLKVYPRDKCTYSRIATSHGLTSAEIVEFVEEEEEGRCSEGRRDTKGCMRNEIVLYMQ